LKGINAEWLHTAMAKCGRLLQFAVTRCAPSGCNDLFDFIIVCGTMLWRPSAFQHISWYAPCVAHLSRTAAIRTAVTSQGEEPSSQIDPGFGRARWLVVVYTETGKSEVHDNAVNLNAVQGAGIQTRQNVANLGVDAVITGNIGPNAFRTLDAAGVRIFLAEKQTVEEAIGALRASGLKEADQANVEGHWA